MRKALLRIFLFLALAVCSQEGALFAQSYPTKESDYYYFNYTIEKIFSHRLGYVVLYRRASNKISRVFIPMEWFNTIGGKGEVVYLGSGTEWPSMIVYYKNGVFSHVRLRLRKLRSHYTWGIIPFNIMADELFENIEELKLEL